jgi:hypothetical protein
MLWNDYQSYPENKAFAVGSNGISGAAWSAATVEQAMHTAKSYCMSNGGIGCEVIDVNGRPPGADFSDPPGASPPARARNGPPSGGSSQVPDTGSSVRYECYTYDYPAQHVLTLPIAPLNSEVGEVNVIFHGEKMKATYLRNGLTQLWLFDENLYVQIDPDLTGKYMDFQGAEEGEQRKPEAIFECKKRR